MKTHSLILIMLVAVNSANARTWTGTNGKTVEADAIKINSNRTVLLKTANGKTLTVPFATFIDEDVQYLESLALIPGGKLHKVTWEQMNELFGLPLFKDPMLLDDPLEEVAERLDLKEETKTDFFRSYCDHGNNLMRKSETAFGQNVQSMTIYTASTNFQGATFVTMSRLRGGSDEDFRDRSSTIEQKLTSVLGNPSDGNLYDDEQIHYWNWNGLIITLSAQDHFISVRIVPSSFFEDSSRNAGRQIKKQCASSVRTADDGTVTIANIPHVNAVSKQQRDKPYSLLECLLRYYGIPADAESLYLADELRGEKYSLKDYSKMWGKFLSEYDIAWQVLAPDALFDQKAQQQYFISIPKIRTYIDAGIPIVFFMSKKGPYTINTDPAVIQPQTYVLITGYNETKKTLTVLYMGNDNPDAPYMKPIEGVFNTSEAMMPSGYFSYVLIPD